MTEKTAIQFYKDIKDEKDKYRLVNNLFIVKYIDKDVCVFVGDFLKRESARNFGKTNKVIISDSENKPLYNKKEKTRKTSLGIWKELNIKFTEKPIKEILK